MTGTCRAGRDLAYVIQRQGDHLVSGRSGATMTPLLAEAPELFFTLGQPRVKHLFCHRPDGRVMGFVDRRKGEDIAWEKRAGLAERLSPTRARRYAPPMKQLPKVAVVAVVVLALTGCVAGSGESAHAASGGMLALFALGLWHGIIGPVILIVEVVNALLPHLLPWKAHLYETQAAGATYDVGFCFGFGSGPFAIWRSRRRA